MTDRERKVTEVRVKVSEVKEKLIEIMNQNLAIKENAPINLKRNLFFIFIIKVIFLTFCIIKSLQCPQE